MTLSNIFIGKRVVQQAFLNDAQIYQSKGWQALPSTMQIVFEKHYTEADNSTIVSVKTDSNSNIVIAKQSEILKTDSDGELLWQKKISNIVTDIVISENDNILYSSKAGITMLNGTDGTIISVERDSTSISALATDGKYIYAASMPPAHLFMIDFKSGNAVSDITLSPTYSSNQISSMITGNFPYIYMISYSDGGGTLIKMQKQEPFSVKSIVYDSFMGWQSKVMADSLGNAYITYSGDLHKYSKDGPLLWKVETPFSNHGGYFSELTVDSQDNAYVNDRYNIYKYSSDGTYLWESEDTYGDTIGLTCDKNNNLIFAKRNGYLKKYISLTHKV